MDGQKTKHSSVNCNLQHLDLSPSQPPAVSRDKDAREPCRQIEEALQQPGIRSHRRLVGSSKQSHHELCNRGSWRGESSLIRNTLSRVTVRHIERLCAKTSRWTAACLLGAHTRLLLVLASKFAPTPVSITRRADFGARVSSSTNLFRPMSDFLPSFSSKMASISTGGFMPK